MSAVQSRRPALSSPLRCLVFHLMMEVIPLAKRCGALKNKRKKENLKLWTSHFVLLPDQQLVSSPRRFRHSAVHPNFGLVFPSYSVTCPKTVSSLRSLVGYIERHTATGQTLNTSQTIPGRAKGCPTLHTDVGQYLATTEHGIYPEFSNNEACIHFAVTFTAILLSVIPVTNAPTGRCKVLQNSSRNLDNEHDTFFRNVGNRSATCHGTVTCSKFTVSAVTAGSRYSNLQ